MTLPTPSATLPRGATVGRYVIVDVIGQGGMGVVYAAYDSQLDRKVALKLLRQELTEGAAAAEAGARALREAQAMARLSHPNVITVHDVGTYGQGVFLAMEFLEGTTLGDWLRTPRPLKERVAVMRDAGRGLAAAHAAGLIHRDFKPDNVLVGRGGRVVVLDFGLARAASDTAAEAPLPSLPSVARLKAAEISGRADDPFSASLTRGGHILGTVGYLAPEQGLEEIANAETDQFAFAATLYVALYGERPFPAQSLDRYLKETFEPPKEPKGGKDVPVRLRRVALRGLSADPTARFPSMDAMLDELSKDPSIARRRLAAAGAAVIGGIALAAAVTLGVRQRALVCAADPGELKGVWDDTTRAAMVSAFERTAVAGARDNAERVATKLDAFAKEWTEMRADACRATRIRKEQPEDVLRLRNDCLDRARREVESVTTMLASASPETVSRSIAVAYGLPQLSWCADTRTLRASAGLPDAPDKRARVIEVRAKLADADSRELTGRLPEARAIAAEAVVLARATEHDPTIADALSVFGRIVSRQGDYTPAAAALSEATFLALGAGANAIVVRTAGRMTFIEVDKLRRPEEAGVWLGVARSALTLVGKNEELELVVMRNEATLLDDTSAHPERALPLREKVVAGYRRLYGVHPDTAIELHNLGETYSDLGDLPRARACFEETVAMAESFGGPDYGGIGATEGMLGQVLLELGETEHGESVLRHAIAICEKNGMDYWTARAVERLSASASARGLTSVALEHGERALRLLAAANSPDDLVSVVGVTAALARIRAGRDDALPLCERALAAEEKANAIDPEKAYGWDALRCKAEALLALGRGAEAVPLLERSLRLKRRTFRGDYARVQFALARALGATHTDPARALELGSAARDELAKYPFLGFELREVEAWLAREAAKPSK